MQDAREAIRDAGHCQSFAGAPIISSHGEVHYQGAASSDAKRFLGYALKTVAVL